MIKDAITLSTQRDTSEGYRETQATIATVGVLQYYGHEIAGNLTQLPDNFDPNKRYGVFRSQDTVFHPQTLASARLKPLTISHPHGHVNAATFRKTSVGVSGESLFVDADNTALGINLLWTDPQAIMLLKSGVKGISAGYTLQLKSQKGSYKGRDYDFVAEGPMILNHLALTPVPRNVEGTHVLDEQGEPMTTSKKKEDIKQNTSDTLTDIDMTALISAISEKMEPKIEEILGSDSFQNKLAERFAGMLAGALDNGDKDEVELADGPSNGIPVDNSDHVMIDSKATMLEKLQSIIDARVNKRVHVEQLAAKLNPKLDINGKKNKEILQLLLKDSIDEDIDTLSLDYLLGVADRLAKTRRDNTDKLASLTDVQGERLGSSAPKNILDFMQNRWKERERGVK